MRFPTRRKLIWQIYPPFLVIVLIALTTIAWLFSQSVNQLYHEQIRHDLEARAKLVLSQVSGRVHLANTASLDQLSKQLGEQTATRLTIIQSQGVVLADSDEDPGLMDNHAKRPEVMMALKGELGVSSRFSHTLQKTMMYVAVPIIENQQIVGCVRAALPMSKIDEALQKVLYQVINSGLAIALVAALVSLWVSRRISRPLEEMKAGAERFAQGQLESRLPHYSSVELGGLAEAMNQMAAQLDDRIRTVVRQRNEQEAVLASMIEGVLAIDDQEKILRINQAAALLLDLNPETAVGRSIQEVVRKPDLQKFTTRALESQKSIEADMTFLHQGKERYLQAHGTPLRGAHGQKIGALVVVNDVTRLRRLENLRRDFVANVSHELKTPITAIKGSVETLLAGAKDNPQDSQRFLEITGRQADRLNAIIDDLLALSRLEKDAESEAIDRNMESLQPILEAAIQACSKGVEAQKAQVKLFCSESLEAPVNAPLLEQAIVNLVDNAIKYSDIGGVVTVEGWQDGDLVKIKVQDRGHGISKEHLPRIFERFYRVDAARSRAIGGTGLGLAIVKHIVQAHNGEVSVHSNPGEGSVFTISLPVS